MIHTKAISNKPLYQFVYCKCIKQVYTTLLKLVGTLNHILRPYFYVYIPQFLIHSLVSSMSLKRTLNINLDVIIQSIMNFSTSSDNWLCLSREND